MVTRPGIATTLPPADDSAAAMFSDAPFCYTGPPLFFPNPSPGDATPSPVLNPYAFWKWDIVAEGRQRQLSSARQDRFPIHASRSETLIRKTDRTALFVQPDQNTKKNCYEGACVLSFFLSLVYDDSGVRA